MFLSEAKKSVLVGGAALVLTIYPILARIEFWPLSSYPIFSFYPETNRVLWPKLVNGESLLLNQDIDVWPLDSFRFYAIVQDLLYVENHEQIKALIRSLRDSQLKAGINGSRLKGELALIQSVWEVEPGFNSINPSKEYEVFKLDLEE